MNVAQLKRTGQLTSETISRGFPHSYECGSIEAVTTWDGAAAIQRLFPHSYECGSIEASRACATLPTLRTGFHIHMNVAQLKLNGLAKKKWRTLSFNIHMNLAQLKPKLLRL